MGAAPLSFTGPMTPISSPDPQPAAPPTQAQALQGAVSYATQQDPVKYAKLLDLQRRTGIPPVVSQGNEQQVQQAADASSFNSPAFVAAAPRTTGWATNPDNAAVSGIDGLHNLAALEQSSAGLRAYVSQPQPPN